MIIRTIAKKETAKRVAAYARVSTMSESQDESFNRQRSYYTDFISQQPNWSLVNIYADRGITGTSAEKRPGFQQMIRDAKAGKIDLTREGSEAIERDSILNDLLEKTLNSKSSPS